MPATGEAMGEKGHSQELSIPFAQLLSLNCPKKMKSIKKKNWSIINSKLPFPQKKKIGVRYARNTSAVNKSVLIFSPSWIQQKPSNVEKKERALCSEM